MKSTHPSPYVQRSGEFWSERDCQSVDVERSGDSWSERDHHTHTSTRIGGTVPRKKKTGSWSERVYSGNHCTTLNGNNGSWTNSDDVKGKKAQKGAAKQKQNKKKNAKPNKPSSVGRQLVDVGLGAMRAFGGPIGGSLASAINLIRGSGAYEGAVVNDKFVRSGYSLESHFGGEDSIVVSDTSFVCDIYTSSVAGAFVNYSFDVSPTNTSLFPWLSSIASNYEEYELLGFIAKYKPTTSPYNANSAMGAIVITASYNPTAPAFNSKSTAENSAGAISARFDQPMLYGLECQRTEAPMQAYFIPVTGDSMSKTFTTVAKLQVCLQPASSFPTSSIIGEFHVAAKMKLKRKRPSVGRLGLVYYCGGSASGSVPFGSSTNSLFTYGSLRGTTFQLDTITLRNVAVGDILKFDYYWGAASNTTITWNTETYNNLSTYACLNDGANYAINGPTVTVSTFVRTACFKVTNVATPPTVILNLTNTLPNPATVNIMITCLGNNLDNTNFSAVETSLTFSQEVESKLGRLASQQKELESLISQLRLNGLPERSDGFIFPTLPDEDSEQDDLKDFSTEELEAILARRGGKKE